MSLPCNKVLHPRHLLLLLVLILLLVHRTLLLGSHERVLIAFVLFEFGVVHVDHGSAHLVHEVLGVRDDDQGAGPLGQLVLQPDDSLHVQVVGGFVEEQQGGALEQRACECDAHAPPARELFGHFVLHLLREPQPEQDDARTCFRAVAQFLHVRLDFVDAPFNGLVLTADFTELHAQFIQLFLEFLDPVIAVHNCLQGSQIRGREFTGQQVYIDTLRDVHQPVPNRVHQHRLAAPVGADQALPRPEVHPQLRFLEQLHAVEGYAQILDEDILQVAVLVLLGLRVRADGVFDELVALHVHQE